MNFRNLLLLIVAIPTTMTAQKVEEPLGVMYPFSIGEYTYDETGNRISQTHFISGKHKNVAMKKKYEYQFEKTVDNKKLSVHVDSHKIRNIQAGKRR